MRINVRVYVGPVHVEHYAGEARTRGLTDVWTGTEHVYGTWTATEDLDTETGRLVERQRVANAVYGRPLATGWRDVTFLGVA
jgi:hypothetical protein